MSAILLPILSLPFGDIRQHSRAHISLHSTGSILCISYISMCTFPTMRSTLSGFHCASRLLVLLATFLCGSVPCASAEGTLQQWQAKALTEFPSLGVPGSAFNSIFLEQVKLLRQKNRKVFQDPSWPYRLAQQVAASSELVRAMEMLDAKSRPAADLPQADGNMKTPTAAGPQSEAVAGNPDRSAALAQWCLHAVEAEIASGAIKEERTVWIQEGKIAPRLRIRALRSAKVINEAACSEVLQQFLEQVLKAPGDLAEEELNWVKAFLADSESHAAFAGLLGASEIELVSGLLAKADSPGFTLDWLGGGPGGFSPPMKIPALRRLEILEKVLSGHFQLGTMHLSKEACQAMCFRINPEVAGGGFLLLEKFPVKDFPESCLVNANAPASKFSPLKKEWVAYMKRLIQMHEDLKAGKFTPFSTYFPACVGTGGFEQFVLWASLRKDSVKESTLWVDSLAPELYKHTGAQAREARRVLPALTYVLNQQALAEARTASVSDPQPLRPTPTPVAASKPAPVTPPRPVPAPAATAKPPATPPAPQKTAQPVPTAK
jgi:hypothetical protein